MLVPLILLVAAVGTAGLMAYGIHPAWGGWAHGLELIQLTRQLQWPLALLSLLLSGVVVLLVVTGRRRAWWLIGLLPVLALFLHRFATDPLVRLGVLENPPLVAADQAALAEGDRVVGLVFQDVAYAFPYATLQRWPVVFLTDFDKRMLFLWSPPANAGWAGMINRDLKARELEVVSMPANGLLVYNARLGQFISGVSGQTPDGQTPHGIEAPLPLTQTDWATWRRLYPQTRVVLPVPGQPSVALQPRYGFPSHASELHDGAPVVVVASYPPVAVPYEQLKTEPLNLPGEAPVVLFRDSAGIARAFDRRIEDLIPKFWLSEGSAGPDALTDTDTGSIWSSSGRQIAGPHELRGFQLKPLAVQDGICWGAARFWHRNLTLHSPAQKNPAPIIAGGDR